MNLDRLNRLPLPPGWRFTEVHEWEQLPGEERAPRGSTVVLTGPVDVPTVFATPGRHELFGCRSRVHVDEVLRHYLPARGVTYPYVGGEQLLMDIEDV